MLFVLRDSVMEIQSGNSFAQRSYKCVPRIQMMRDVGQAFTTRDCKGIQCVLVNEME